MTGKNHRKAHNVQAVKLKSKGPVPHIPTFSLFLFEHLRFVGIGTEVHRALSIRIGLRKPHTTSCSAFFLLLPSPCPEETHIMSSSKVDETLGGLCKLLYGAEA